jgi:hypothetical protein
MTGFVFMGKITWLNRRIGYRYTVEKRQDNTVHGRLTLLHFEKKSQTEEARRLAVICLGLICRERIARGVACMAPA